MNAAQRGIDMARKCGLCGIEGHNSRKCPNLDADREEIKRQKNIPTPEVIHISRGGGIVCGIERFEWPNRCLDDSFASTLPICPDCQLLNSNMDNA